MNKDNNLDWLVDIGFHRLQEEEDNQIVFGRQSERLIYDTIHKKIIGYYSTTPGNTQDISHNLGSD